MTHPSQEELRQLLRYNAILGKLFFRKPYREVRSETITIRKRKYRTKNIIWKMVTGEDQEYIVGESFKIKDLKPGTKPRAEPAPRSPKTVYPSQEAVRKQYDYRKGLVVRDTQQRPKLRKNKVQVGRRWYKAFLVTWIWFHGEPEGYIHCLGEPDNHEIQNCHCRWLEPKCGIEKQDGGYVAIFHNHVIGTYDKSIEAVKAYTQFAGEIPCLKN